jgi:hypothetical protein
MKEIEHLALLEAERAAELARFRSALLATGVAGDTDVLLPGPGGPPPPQTLEEAVGTEPPPRGTAEVLAELRRLKSELGMARRQTAEQYEAASALRRQLDGYATDRETLREVLKGFHRSGAWYQSVTVPAEDYLAWCRRAGL